MLGLLEKLTIAELASGSGTSGGPDPQGGEKHPIQHHQIQISGVPGTPGPAVKTERIHEDAYLPG
jgi:hypothetical protein